MKISFHGADCGVTGSCHLIECADKLVLIDCGMYQGGRELEQENAEPFGFEPEDIDYMLLTHGHLDHCGRLPLLVKRGFKGEVITTSASRELAKIVLLDAAHLQEEEALYRRKSGKVRPVPGHSAPLYETLDALNSLDYFGRSAVYGQPIELAPGIRATFIDAGHILGSACVLLELSEEGKSKRVLFSGDLGNAGRPLLRAPAACKTDVVVMETTYGDRVHKPLDSSITELYDAINMTFARNGNVFIPTFALERAQELLYFLRVGLEQKKLPGLRHIFLDSPMAISATQIFERHPECYGDTIKAMFKEKRDPFLMPGLSFCRQASESKAINDITTGAVVMAGAGMCTGGRIRHHLRNNLGRKECSVVFVGYAAQGTPARAIIDGAKAIHLFGEEIPVKADIHTIGGFSAHADQSELLAWHAQTQAKTTFLVHGEEKSMRAIAQRLKNTKIEMPRLNEAFAL